MPDVQLVYEVAWQKILHFILMIHWYSVKNHLQRIPVTLNSLPQRAEILPVRVEERSLILKEEYP